MTPESIPLFCSFSFSSESSPEERIFSSLRPSSCSISSKTALTSSKGASVFLVYIHIEINGLFNTNFILNVMRRAAYLKGLMHAASNWWLDSLGNIPVVIVQVTFTRDSITLNNIFEETFVVTRRLHLLTQCWRGNRRHLFNFWNLSINPIGQVLWRTRGQLEIIGHYSRCLVRAEVRIEYEQVANVLCCWFSEMKYVRGSVVVFIGRCEAQTAGLCHDDLEAMNMLVQIG